MREREPREVKRRKGLVVLYTGQGKGKTTAALGTLLRAWGHGLRSCVLQFIKDRRGRWGEIKAAERLGIEWHSLGSGFTWRSPDIQDAIDRARQTWKLAQAKIVSGDYDLIILDEFTYPLKDGWLDTESVIAWLSEHKPPMLHLVITGRDAPANLVDFADLVTEMKKVKHPYDQGVRAQAGMEF